MNTIQSLSDSIAEQDIAREVMRENIHAALDNCAQIMLRLSQVSHRVRGGAEQKPNNQNQPQRK